MSKNFYIADTHFGHSNIIRFDNRHFKNVEDMDETLINNWNNVVSNEDTVYILGDFCWDKEDRWIEILDQLKGKKVLIKGNHDIKHMSSKLRNKFQDVKELKEIKDSGKRVIMCHYPIPFYRADYNPDMIMLYGHIHTTIENDFMNAFKETIKEHDTRKRGRHQCQFYNVGCMMSWMNYTPKTLDEIIEGAENG